jgi:hypothetical protein
MFNLLSSLRRAFYKQNEKVAKFLSLTAAQKFLPPTFSTLMLLSPATGKIITNKNRVAFSGAMFMGIRQKGVGQTDMFISCVDTTHFFINGKMLINIFITF